MGSICYPKSHWTEWEKPRAYCADGGEGAGRQLCPWEYGFRGRETRWQVNSEICQEEALVNKKLRTVKSLKEDFSFKIFFPAQAIKISSVLVPVCWKCYVHSQKNCQMILLPHCCKQKDIFVYKNFSFSKYLGKLTYGKNPSFRMVEISLLSCFVSRKMSCMQYWVVIISIAEPGVNYH